MIQLAILSGKTAGTRWATRRFPVRVGRSPDCDLQLEEHGVWDEHFEISLNPAAGFVLEARSDALVIANHQPIEHTVLRNGDLIEIGAVKLQFWLGETDQRGLGFREALFWTLILAVCVCQIALIYWLVR
jgi:pSer/pThr/pTyr-binding forkhead associated (FHA) protein